ncbi:sugar phosphate isomerase/epimerase family protein [Dyadobacter subterraneus]|uniref:Sugar phosphate isomerase/epimerase n=1 Tax=Dyadobacter subterraneus TaxID=2773304 RepID=A0ABR9WD76_9BACT|nr:sugar phosphate isomerase/epimerase [Dyadobacter subterraneus]MBE9463437.1 sugar phosphate isomerase/epimerase [Dyadobacter subterraneus]
MKSSSSFLTLLLIFTISISFAQKKTKVTDDWKFGVAMYTFHTVNFPEALLKVDSAKLHYIEGMTFHKSGPDLKDSLISQLSPSGIKKLKKLVNEKGIKIESIYIGGGKTVDSWKKEFEIAKNFGVKFVSAEPPVNMWDSIDSLAGVYGMKVAIHEHWKGVSAYWHPDSVLAAVKNHPNFGACADLGHWPKSGIDPLDAIKKLKGHIIAIHLKDIAAFNNPKLLDVTVGTGVIDFPGIFAELKKQDFRGYIYIEKDETQKPSNLNSVLEAAKYYNTEVKKLK